MLWKEGVWFCKVEFLWFFCCLYLFDYIVIGLSYICILNICIGVINMFIVIKVGDIMLNVYDIGIVFLFINLLLLD